MQYIQKALGVALITAVGCGDATLLQGDVHVPIRDTGTSDIAAAGDGPQAADAGVGADTGGSADTGVSVDASNDVGVSSDTIAADTGHAPDTTSTPDTTVAPDTVSPPDTGNPGCSATDVRNNGQNPPIKGGLDYIFNGFYVAYSLRANPSNNASMYIIDGVGAIWLYGNGYGDVPIAPNGAAYDAGLIDNAITQCMGYARSAKPIKTFVPHAHGDHHNSQFLGELEDLGYDVTEVHVHGSDLNLATSGQFWKTTDFVTAPQVISHGNAGNGCTDEIINFDTLVGGSVSRAWGRLRAGHTPGATDLVIELNNDPSDRIYILGSAKPGQAGAGNCPTPSGTSYTFFAHATQTL